MDDHEKAELRQLWFVARHYWKCAKALRRRLPISCKTGSEVSRLFYDRVAPEGLDRAEVLLRAHLGSIAVRLRAITEVPGFPEERVREDGQGYLKKLTDGTPKLSSGETVRALRDNVAHVEGQNERYIQRERYLDRQRTVQLYEAVEKALDDLQEILRASEFI